MKILTWNIGHTNRVISTSKAWYATDVAKIVWNGDYDIVCLQEVPLFFNKSGKQYLYIDSLMTCPIRIWNKLYQRYIPVSVPSGIRQITTLVNKEKHTILGAWPRSHQTIKPCALTTVISENKKTSRKSYIHNVHLTAHPSNKATRVKEIDAIKLKPNNIICGDFNDIAPHKLHNYLNSFQKQITTNGSCACKNNKLMPYDHILIPGNNSKRNVLNFPPNIEPHNYEHYHYPVESV